MVPLDTGSANAGSAGRDQVRALVARRLARQDELAPGVEGRDGHLGSQLPGCCDELPPGRLEAIPPDAAEAQWPERAPVHRERVARDQEREGLRGAKRVHVATSE